MLIIAHRGNLSGSNPISENQPEYIDDALRNGFDAEIDLRIVNDELFLGHDSPDHRIDFDWLLNRRNFLWIHCKNAEALVFLNNNTSANLNYFWHNTDDYTLTSLGYIWAFPELPNIGKYCISVMPRIIDTPKLYKSYSFGVCTDYAIATRELLLANKECF